MVVFIILQLGIKIFNRFWWISGVFSFWSEKIDLKGVHFKSHLDGSYHYFTPEGVFAMQEIFGSDIIMPLDICSSYGIDYNEANLYTNITTNWARSTFKAYKIKRGIQRAFIFNNSGKLF